MTTTALRTDKPSTDKPKPGTYHRAATTYVSLEAHVRKSIEEDCPYAFYFRFLRFSSCNGTLTVRGCLPSFYLKQVLIAHLQRVDYLLQIDDQVDVISSNGLSSVRDRAVA